MEMHKAYAFLYLEVNLMAVLVIAIVRIKTQGLSRMVAQRNFSMATDAEILCILSDTIYVMIRSGALPYSRFAVMALKEIYFLATPLMCFFWFIYFEYMQDSPFVRNRRNILISSVLVWILGALLIANPFTGLLFYVDEANVYRRGPLFMLQYLLSYVYVFGAGLRALAALFREKNEARRRLLTSLVLFPLAPAAAGILQYLYQELPLACMTLSLATLVMYLEWIDQVISLDPLTRLNNRKQLAYFFEQWQHNGESDVPLYLLLVDANKFKGINDTYGHTEGDAALVRISDALRQGCRGFPRRVNIARYGGDEFVVLAYAEDPEMIEALRERINGRLAALNEKAAAPYELSVSIGIARADPSMSLKEVIEAADEQLYAEKKARRQRA